MARSHGPELFGNHKVTKIINARLPGHGIDDLWDVNVDDMTVSSVAHSHSYRDSQLGSEEIDARCQILAPSLCHAHVHLDKCFLLQDDKYEDLQIVKGDFQEAMHLTGKAKERFEEADLLRRGRRLIEESIKAGVTAMRAFVEVDEVVELKCVNAAKQLKAEYENSCHIQICSFAQLSVFDKQTGEVRRGLMSSALANQIDTVGSTPYVETSEENMKRNVDWAIDLAIENHLHLDFHLDYNLDKQIEPLIWYVVDTLHLKDWMKHMGPSKTICVSHCARLTLFNESDWIKLRAKLGDLPLHFVGLPMSDLFMMGRQNPSFGQKVRGTLPILDLINNFGLNGCIGINNIGNAFTPSGTCDPLTLASFGVSIYQSATKHDCEILYESVSSRAKRAIGLPCMSTNTIDRGTIADLCLYGSVLDNQPGPKTVAELVYYASRNRATIYQGKALF